MDGVAISATRVEEGSDRIVTPAKLTAMLRLKNTSTNQTVRLLDGKLPTLKFATYGSERPA